MNLRRPNGGEQPDVFEGAPLPQSPKSDEARALRNDQINNKLTSNKAAPTVRINVSWCARSDKLVVQIKAGPATTVKDRGWTLTITTRGSPIAMATQTLLLSQPYDNCVTKLLINAQLRSPHKSRASS